MNIIEKMQEILSEYPDIAQFTNEIDVDFTSSEPTSFGLSSTSDTLVRASIIGKEIRQHNFVMYATKESFNSYMRLANSSFILNLAYYLDKIKDIKIEEGTIKRIWTANGMAYEVPTGDINDGIRYQLQIYAEYERG